MNTSEIRKVCYGWQECQHCGRRGADVHLQPSYQGGIGTILTLQCEDVTACWTRWDEKQKEVEA